MLGNSNDKNPKSDSTHKNYELRINSKIRIFSTVEFEAFEYITTGQKKDGPLEEKRKSDFLNFNFFTTLYKLV